MGEPSATQQRRRIVKVRTEPVSRIGDGERDAMFELFQRYYDRVTREEFLRDLAGKQDLIRLFDQHGQVSGFTTIQHLHTEHAGRARLVVFSGDTVVDRECWGQKKLQVAFSRYLLGLKLRHPIRRVYWFLISKGFKTYLLMRHNLTSYPGHQGPTPSDVQALIDHVSRLKYPEHYDPERGVIAVPEGCVVTPEAGTVTDDDRRDPDIRFFLERNPGWVEGEELCCLAELRLPELLWSAVRYTASALGRKRKRPRPAKTPAQAPDP